MLCPVSMHMIGNSGVYAQFNINSGSAMLMISQLAC